MGLGTARVIYSINDLSLYTDELLRGYVVALVETERGPLWEPIMVHSWDEYERMFGRTFAGSNDPLVLKMGLLQGAKFVVIRLANCTDPSDKSTITATKASVTLNDRGGTPTSASVTSDVGPFVFAAPYAGNVTGSEVGPYTIVTGESDAITIAVGAGADQPVVLTQGTRTAQNVVDEINAQTTSLTASIVDGCVKIAANTITDDIIIKAVANDAYTALGLTTGTYPAYAGTNSLVIAVDGEADQTFEMTAGTLTAGQVVTLLSTLAGATASASQGKLIITSDTTGLSSTIQIQATTTATAFGFSNDEVTGTEGVPQPTLTFESANEGAWGNSLKIDVYDADLNPDTRFDVRVTYTLQGGMNEYFGNLSMDPEDERYVVNYINERSLLVFVTDEGSTNPAYTNRPAETVSSQILTGGLDSDPLTAADYIGDDLAQTGIYAIDKTDLAMDVIIPGTTNISVLQSLIAFCENRGEYFAHINLPAGLDPNDAKAFRMGETPYSHEAFNSPYAALYYGRPLCYDSRTDSRKYISNLGHLSKCIANTDTNYDYHYAPVGPRRGVVDLVEGLDFNVHDWRGYRDLFAENQMNYLMISRDKGIEGAVFWENYTTQRAPSALREINVVRFLIAMRKVLVPVLRMFLFEPNHPLTWREIHRTLEPQFRLWKDKASIYDFVLQTDRDAFFDGGVLKNAVLNSGLEIDQGIYRARALVQPTRAIRYLEFEVGVLRTGEAFSEFTALKELPGWVRTS